ncbi:hypothetical protein C0Q70_05891 [Pomacea canaliculata]|uniref:Uncharacterized protein n=1 Tax=Pomacea canaliculata TaxID=400727 RepID=A0A2T7PMG7_POMCA|nr:hypothetical protein C0Q70_05891 [Pomacea canaliculata]
MTLTPAVPMKVGPVDCKENKSEVAPFIGSFHPVSRSSSVQLAAAVDHTRFITRRCQTFHLGLPEVTLLGRLLNSKRPVIETSEESSILQIEGSVSECVCNQVKPMEEPLSHLL